MTDGGPGLPPEEPPWPRSYQGRIDALGAEQAALLAILGPMHDAARAFRVLGGLQSWQSADDIVGWPLPAGATLTIRVGYRLHTDLGKIGEGVVPQPDPLVCLASALCTPELWAEAMGAFRLARAWAAQQAADYAVLDDAPSG